MIPLQWTPPCNNQCTQKYASLMQIPWRVFCKKGCDSDGDSWEECLGECDELCYKDPVLKDQKWSSYIDRSPGAVGYSEECFRACVAGCGYKFDIPQKEVENIRPNRPAWTPSAEKPPQPAVVARQPLEPRSTSEDIPGTSA
ncbi:unnamed protein product [Cuscuta epithymum]|uniref:Uncharacterized protein n=1 Tax=Cuscuta epithymum TaxID=186058 RepID=A0AAV0DB34_9ASTE|nr:unnamed protein product [Cuscuta epithymum]